MFGCGLKFFDAKGSHAGHSQLLRESRSRSFGRTTTIMFSERDILAVCFGLQQFFSKDSLHLEKNCCKASALKPGTPRWSQREQAKNP
jgi:hypothetical protein